MTEEEEFKALREFFEARKKKEGGEKRGGMPRSAIPSNSSVVFHDKKTNKDYRDAIELSIDTDVPISEVLESCDNLDGRFQRIEGK